MELLNTISDWNKEKYEHIYNKGFAIDDDFAFFVPDYRGTPDMDYFWRRYYLANNGTDDIGIAYLQLNNMKNAMHSSIYILPEFKKKGYGTNIKKELEVKVKSHNCEYIACEVNETNTVAIKLSENAGWELTGRQEGSQIIRGKAYAINYYRKKL